MVITGLTRNQFARKRTWVRIPPSPPNVKNRLQAKNLQPVFLRAKSDKANKSPNETCGDVSYLAFLFQFLHQFVDFGLGFFCSAAYLEAKLVAPEVTICGEKRLHAAEIVYVCDVVHPVFEDQV